MNLPAGSSGEVHTEERPMKRINYLPVALTVFLSVNALASGDALYKKQCAPCHHPERYGVTAPPLIPEYLGRRKQKELHDIISNGLPATNMPSFKSYLNDSEIDALVSYIMSPVEKPAWGEKEMRSSWRPGAYAADGKKPLYDLRNLFMIVEGGAGRVHFMDGDSFRLLDSIWAGAIHGGPKFDKDLRYSYIVTRDGWVIKYDLVNLNESGRIRAGISSRNIAISSDSRRLAIANLLPDNLVIMDTARMEPVKSITSEGAFGAVYGLKDKKEFVVAMRDKPSLLLIDEKTFDVKEIKTDQPFTDFFIGPEERYVVGTSREGAMISVVDLEKGGVVKTIKSDGGMPHLASAAVWKDGDSTYAAFPHIGKPSISVMELYSWKVKTEIQIKGPGFFARTHENIPHLWVDTGTDTIQLIDKKTLGITGEITPRKDKKAMHIEFTKDGAMALVSIAENDGAVNIYDSRTLKLLKTLPFNRPVGKYNATNKKF